MFLKSSLVAIAVQRVQGGLQKCQIQGAETAPAPVLGHFGTLPGKLKFFKFVCRLEGREGNFENFDFFPKQGQQGLKHDSMPWGQFRDIFAKPPCSLEVCSVSTRFFDFPLKRTSVVFGKVAGTAHLVFVV